MKDCHKAILTGAGDSGGVCVCVWGGGQNSVIKGFQHGFQIVLSNLVYGVRSGLFPLIGHTMSLETTSPTEIVLSKTPPRIEIVIRQ